MNDNRPIRIGIIGTHYATAVQVPAFRALPEFEIAAITSGRYERAQKAASELGIPRAFENYQELLRSPEIDAVYIGAPPALHCEMAVAAAMAGKHFLCEKPTASSATEALTMLQAAQAAGVVAMMDFEFRYRPERRHMAQMVKSGYLGRPFGVHCETFSGFLLGPERYWNWWSERSQAGGLLGAAGSHLIDNLRMCFGEVRSVRAQLNTGIGERPTAKGEPARKVDSDDSFSVLFEFESGMWGSLIGSGLCTVATQNRTRAYGSSGSLLLTEPFGAAGRITGDLSGSDSTLVGGLPDGSTVRLSPPPELASSGADIEERIRLSALLCRDFAQAIRKGSADAPTLLDGLRCQEIMDAVYASSATGRVTEVTRHNGN